ncbi:hypothetical protein ABWH96_18545 [Marivirga tractuosa]|uniref:hypothetical protein n=1 Tax=Marivirga tractuosa TaxID=1006 RepID=UPI0035D0ACA2
MAKISFENLYRKIVKGFNDNPPESVWQNIQDELDIDEVWSQLDNQLPSSATKTNYSSVRQIVNYALFFLLIFFFKNNSDQQLSSSYLIADNNQETLLLEETTKKEIDTEQEKDESLIATNKEIEDTEAPTKKELIQKKSIDQNKVSENSNPTQILDNKNNDIVEKIISDLTKTENFEDVKNDESYSSIQNSILNYLNPIPADFESILIVNFPEALPIDSIPSINTSDYKNPFIKFSGIGAVGNMKNSWIINNATRASFNNESLINTEITYTNDFGLSSQFTIRSQQIIQLSYWFRARNTQNYFQYYNANYSRKEFIITYQSFSIDLLQPLFSTNNYLIFGFQLAKIGSVEETLAGNFSDLSNNYSDWNYGVDLGLQKKFKLHPKLSFQPALRFHYGLNNIFVGNEFVPREFDYTRPASISLDFRFFYHFIK